MSEWMTLVVAVSAHRAAGNGQFAARFGGPPPAPAPAPAAAAPTAPEQQGAARQGGAAGGGRGGGRGGAPPLPGQYMVFTLPQK